MEMIGIIFLIIVVVVMLGIIEGVRECKDFVVTHYAITPYKWEKKGKETEIGKLVVISDLHNKEYGVRNERLLEAIRKEKPDAIMVAGDILVGKYEEPIDVGVAFMEEVAKIAPVYYGNGNHEQRMRDDQGKYGTMYQEYREVLERIGVILLENDTATMQIKDHEILVTGLEIDAQCFERRNSYQLKVTEIEEAIGESSEAYRILIAHHPHYCKEYVAWGADLVLSGHLHGGIVRLPKIGAVITPQFSLMPKYCGGHYHLGESDIVVSRGLGEHTIKLRVLNRPELVVLHLQEH